MSTFENTSEMYVTKRNGNKEIISFDKILQRIKKTGKDANIKINYTSLVIKIIDQLFDGIPTDKIDEISAEQCATMSSIHYDYGTLASRLIISNHHKNTSISFSKTMKRLYTEQMLSDVFMQNVNANAKQLDTLIDYNRDYLIDYFGFKTLERSYLMSIKKRVQERPQMMFLRLAVAIHGTDFQKIQETYHALSNKQMIHGTPSLYNADFSLEDLRKHVWEPSKSTETIQKKADAIRGSKRETKICPHCNQSVAVNGYARWHGPNCRNINTP
jgi:hypothetical protein